MSNETKWVWTNNGGMPNEGVDTDGGNAPIGGYTEPPTRRMNKTVPGGMDEQSTRFRPAGEDEAGADDQVEPVVGWLVVVKGPGLGRSLTVQQGRSSIGRGENQRIQLPFGDMSMSRNQAQIVYDPTSRRFLISEGDGTSLTRINGELLMGNAQLKGGELIDLGDATQVRFVPFCGAHFDWAELDEPPEESA